MTAAATATTSTTAVTTAASKSISVRKVTSTRSNRPGIGVELLTAGSAACVADLFTFPLDTAKVRLQVSQTQMKMKFMCRRAKFSRRAILILIQIQGETSGTLKYSGVYGTVSGIARNEGAR